MKSKIKNDLLRSAFKIITIQTVCVLALSLIYAVIMGIQAGYSALLGGSICIIANLGFAQRMFKHTGAQASKEIVKSFYRAEMRKIMITVILFAVMLKYLSLMYSVFFTSYILAQMIFWLAAWPTRLKSARHQLEQMEHNV